MTNNSTYQIASPYKEKLMDLKAQLDSLTPGSEEHNILREIAATLFEYRDKVSTTEA